ncbi:hypothetical protein LOS78_12765 [Paracoccus sp. MA]|uniref:hypothetical protein n=1 Tax=Paracoccus sp. MA TaxID=2895796 RepID=UPI001E48841A|nr:hypothetical protein [Paracoccus sp. MA]UFM66798.1 hypothetical protein LOS78_12765 [Paracoccus sp. MA]
MTHPRTEIKNNIKALLDPIGPPVYVSRARDLRKGEDEAIIIYAPQETLRRGPGTGEMRPGMPVFRATTIEILVLTRKPGDGQEAAERGDELARAIELALNDGAPALAPTAASQAFSEAEQTQCLTAITYVIDHIDSMKGSAA